MTTVETTAPDQLAGSGTWQIDPAHSSANFSVRHLGLSKVRGHFDDIDGTLEIADDPTQSSIRVTIDPATIETNNADRNAHLRSADFFDVERYPTLEFRSTRIERNSDHDWTVDGQLTIHGVTQLVTLDVEYLGAAEDPMGAGQRVAFEATTEIVRHDFGLTWEGPQQARGAMVGKKVQIDVDVQFVQAA